MDAKDTEIPGRSMERCGAAPRGVHQQAERRAPVQVSPN